MPIDNWSDDVVVVHLSDDPQFTDDLETLESSRRKNPRQVVLDFSAVRFINSSNISRLLKLRKQMVAEEARLVFCSMGTQVWTAFLVTGLDKIFEFTDNVPTALATLSMEAEARESDEAARESSAPPRRAGAKSDAKAGTPKGPKKAEKGKK